MGGDQSNHKEVLSIISTQSLPYPWKHSLHHLLDVSIQLLVPRLFRCTLKKIQLTLSIAKWTEYFAVNNSLYIITEMVSIPCLLFSQKHISDSFNIIIHAFLFLFSNIIYMYQIPVYIHIPPNIGRSQPVTLCGQHWPYQEFSVVVIVIIIYKDKNENHSLTNRLAKNENLSNGWTKKIQLPHNHGHLLAHEQNNYHQNKFYQLDCK